jgi:hypothetical protein
VDEWQEKERNIRSAVMESSVKDSKGFDRKSRALKTYQVRELGGACEMLFTVWGDASAGCFLEGSPMRIFNASPVREGLAATDGTRVALITTAAAVSGSSAAAAAGRRLTSLAEAARLEGPAEVDLVATLLVATTHPTTGAPVLFFADPTLRLLRLDAPTDAPRTSLPFSAALGDTLVLANLSVGQPSRGGVGADWTHRVFATASPKGLSAHGAALQHLGSTLLATEEWAASTLGQAALTLATRHAAALPLDRPLQLRRVGGPLVREVRMAAARVVSLRPGCSNVVTALLEDGCRVVQVRLSALLLLAALRLARDDVSHAHNDLALVLLVAAATDSADSLAAEASFSDLTYMLGAAPLDFALGLTEPNPGDAKGAQGALEVLAVEKAA